MAYDPNEQFASSTGSTKPSVANSRIQPKTFASGTDLLAVLTPVAYNTSTNQWVVWTNGGANGTGTIRGFVWEDEVQLVSGSEVLGNVLIAGDLNYDDIVLPSGESDANLKTAVRAGSPSLRELGINILGLDQIR